MKLVSIEGGPPGAEYELGPRPLMIGRAATCDIRVDDPEISYEHCRIAPSGDDFVVEDLHSRNGTIVNGRPINQPTRLKPGDLILAGRALLEVRGLRPPTPPRAPALPAVPAMLSSSPTPVGGSLPLATAAREAARAGQAVRSRLDALLVHLAGAPPAPAQSGRLAAALRRAEQAGGEAEARRVLAIVQQALNAPNPRQRTELLMAEAATLHRAVSAALDLLGAVREA